MVKQTRIIAISIVIIAALLSLPGCSATAKAPTTSFPGLPEVSVPVSSEAAETGEPVTNDEPVVDNAVKPSSSASSSGNASPSASSSSGSTHTHSWVYHDAQYETVHHAAVTKRAAICNTCAADITGNVSSHLENHMLNGENGS